MASLQIGFVESPAMLFIMPDSNNEKQEELEEQLQTLGEVLASEKITLQSPRVDHPCLARYAVDGLFYRGIVKSVGNSDCLVQYVDFGNSAFIANDDLYPLPVDLLEAPCAVLKCSICHVDTRDLTADVVEDFLKRVHEGDPAIVEPARLVNPAAPPCDHFWRIHLFNIDGNAVDWQKQKRPVSQNLDTAVVNLSVQGGETEEGHSNQRSDQEAVSGAVGGPAVSAPVGDLLGMGGFAPQPSPDEELKQVLAISMLEY